MWLKLKSIWTEGRVVRLESRLLRGWPDVHWVRGGRSGWLELKIGRLRRDGRLSLHRLRLEQCIWLDAHSRAGGDAAILAAAENADQLFLLRSPMRRWLMPIDISNSEWTGGKLELYNLPRHLAPDVRRT